MHYSAIRGDRGSLYFGDLRDVSTTIIALTRVWSILLMMLPGTFLVSFMKVLYFYLMNSVPGMVRSFYLYFLSIGFV